MIYLIKVDMKNIARIANYYVFSPYLVIAALWVAVMFLNVKNAMNWGLSYQLGSYVSYDVYITYTAAFVLCHLLFVILYKKQVYLPDEWENPAQTGSFFADKRLVGFVFVIAVVFQVAKFVNIGDVPLLGDPMSRYRLTLGGYEDFPSRLLFPTGLVAYIFFKETRRLVWMFIVISCLVLPLLLFQRQEVVNLLGGLIVFECIKREISFKVFFKYLILTALVMYLVVGYLSVVRYGAENLSGRVDPWLIPLWVLHGELCLPLGLGEMVSRYVGAGGLGGQYTLGAYLSIFIPNFKSHGAEAVRVLFTNKDTAQSIGMPISYYLDFGMIGVWVVGCISSVTMFFLYLKARTSANSFWMVVYIVTLMSMLWSLRAGNLFITPIQIYVLAVVFIMCHKSLNAPLSLNGIIGFAFISSLFVSVVGLAARL